MTVSWIASYSVFPIRSRLRSGREKELSAEAEKDWSDAIGCLFNQAHAVKRVTNCCPTWSAFSPEAKSLWVEWFNAHAAEMEDPGFSDRHAGVYSKLRAHAPRFALILSRLRLACDPCPPQEPQLGRRRMSRPCPLRFLTMSGGAVKLVEYFKSNLTRISQQMTAGIGSADAKALVDWIKRRRKTMFREAEVRADLRRFRDHPRIWPPQSTALEGTWE